jgi:hypothetical protein
MSGFLSTSSENSRKLDAPPERFLQVSCESIGSGGWLYYDRWKNNCKNRLATGMDFFETAAKNEGQKHRHGTDFLPEIFLPG